MRAGLQPLRADHWLASAGAEADDVGATYRLLHRGRRLGAIIAGSQPLGRGKTLRGDAYLAELAHTRHHLQMRLALHARADDCQNLRILSREELGRQRGGSRRPQRSDVGAVHHADGHTGLGVEKADEGVMSRQAACLIPMKD